MPLYTAANRQFALTHKLGRQPRSYDPRIPHLSQLPQLVSSTPPARDWGGGLTSMGYMDNSQLGDCVIAAAGHGVQTTSKVAIGTEITPPDEQIIDMYSRIAGYVRGRPNTDHGTNMQSALRWYLLHGIEIGPGQTEQLIAYIEVDHTKTTNVNAVINECGGIQVGFYMPAYAYQAGVMKWDYDGTGDQRVVGGHAVWIPRYSFVSGRSSYWCVSWGTWYEMTRRFFAKWVEEAYGLFMQSWINNQNKTPLGFTQAQLQAWMAALR